MHTTTPHIRTGALRGRAATVAAGLVFTAACAATEEGSPGAAAGDASGVDAVAMDAAATVDAAASAPSPFATSVVAFAPGPGAGFGQDAMPHVVLGPPRGGGAKAGSLDVVSLGGGGAITLSFDVAIVDAPGPDLLIFENAFAGWPEPALVEVSDDGEVWHSFACDPLDKAGGYPGCAGVAPTLAHPDNGVDPRDPALAGGDAFDLAHLGLSRARFVRVRDSGKNPLQAPTGGADLDAVAVIHAGPR